MAASVVIAAVIVAFAASVSLARTPPQRARSLGPRPLRAATSHTAPGTANCTERYHTQPLDHYTHASGGHTFQQRWFDCVPAGVDWQPNGTIFFYTGNEANVELFVNMTGLMWENAAEFGARLVFAEHRYFGKSLPLPGEDMPAPEKLQWLTADQALEDYAHLIRHLRATEWASPASPVIAFGGSYGGMLAAWLRVKFPGVVDGAIASSAPVVNFEDMKPAYDPYAFPAAVTFDATPAGGAAAGCAENIRQSWGDIEALGATPDGLATLSSIFRTCAPLRTADDVASLVGYIQE